MDLLAVWVRRNDAWLLDYVREIAPAPPATDAPAPIQQLAWMLGSWEAVGDAAKAQLDVTLSEDGHYLLQRFSAELPSGTLRGEQRIAWDAKAGEFRSWLFRSDGGFLEGTWRQEGEAWVAEQVGVLPGGVAMQAVNLWVPEPPDKCWYKTHRATVDGDDLEEVVLEFRRKSEEAR